MTEGLFEAFRIPEVRKRILFTLWIIIVFRLGAWIPVPGVDPQRLKDIFEQLGQLGQFLSAFTGGALERFSIFALGVIPYINASIILSLLVAVIPKLKELQEQGEEGRRVINKITRYATVGLAFIQAAGTSYLIYTQGLVQAGQSFFRVYVYLYRCAHHGDDVLDVAGRAPHRERHRPGHLDDHHDRDSRRLSPLCRYSLA